MNILPNFLNRELTLEGILDTFNSTVEKLNKLETQNAVKVEQNEAERANLEKKIGELKSANDTLNDEATKAKAVKAKIQALITV